MKVSIITVVYNNKDTIKDAIKSVLNQTYKNIEYIIIDGASNDGTVDIIKSYGDNIDKFVSEPDKGIYDAMNKGIKLATGDIIGILNSDDFYVDKKVIEKVVKVFSDSEGKCEGDSEEVMVDSDSMRCDCVYGDLVYVDSKDTNKIVRYWKSKDYKEDLFKTG